MSSITTKFAGFVRQYQQDSRNSPSEYEKLIDDRVPANQPDFIISALHSLQLELEEEKEATATLKQIVRQFTEIVASQATGPNRAKVLEIEKLVKSLQ